MALRRDNTASKAMWDSLVRDVRTCLGMSEAAVDAFDEMAEKLDEFICKLSLAVHPSVARPRPALLLRLLPLLATVVHVLVGLVLRR